ncbi:MAG: type II toxin-antitoxin system VapC family toxin [Candidatus Bathyarchaeota archaeon]|nr:type II toxin-antitoxin system VapC family toxin [Candidatus Bathyarchaeota archaeon]
MLDSNIIAKLVLNEPDSKQARASIKSYAKKGYSLYTVDTAFAECLNVIWKHATLLGDLSSEDAKSATEYLAKVFNGINIAATQDLAEETIKIAQTKKTPVYDALYIALAQKTKGTLYTADQKLCALAKTTINTKLLQP